MKRLFLICLFLSGCTASFQPYPSYSKAEIQSGFQQIDQKIQILAEQLAKLSPKEEVKKK